MPMSEETKTHIQSSSIFLLRFRKDGLENIGSGKFHVRIDQGVYLSY